MTARSRRARQTTRRMPLAWGVLRKDKGDDVWFVWEIDDPGGSIGMRGNSQFTFWAVILHSTGSGEIAGHKGTQRYILGMLSTALGFFWM